MAKFLATFEEISPEWLITGKGDMLRSTSSTSSSDHFRDTTKMIPASGGEGIPLIPTSAMAGMFQGETIVLEYECDKYIVPAFKDAEFLISVKGSSMIPKYNSGDIVACKRMPLDTFFQWNKVYVLDTEQGALIKRVKRGTTNDTLTICSDNPSYDPFELSRDKIYHIALVVGVIRLE
ncbi:MAG: S24 family peptidase [Bacteroidales bacterium]|nr:S24 family peptidase [Bacteroidales bacterium]